MRDRSKVRTLFGFPLCKFHTIGGQNARDRDVFYTFHSFLMEAQTNAGYIRAAHAS